MQPPPGRRPGPNPGGSRVRPQPQGGCIRFRKQSRPHRGCLRIPTDRLDKQEGKKQGRHKPRRKEKAGKLETEKGGATIKAMQLKRPERPCPHKAYSFQPQPQTGVSFLTGNFGGGTGSLGGGGVMGEECIGEGVGQPECPSYFYRGQRCRGKGKGRHRGERNVAR